MFEKEEESADLSSILPLGCDEEKVKEVKGLKNVTPKKLLTRLPVLLAQTKAGYNPYKQKTETWEIPHLLHQHYKITKSLSNNLIKSL